MTPDGTRVFLGYSMNHGALWTIPQPRGRVPAWFPDFLESLAQMRLGKEGDVRLLRRDDRRSFGARLVGENGSDPYAEWARKVIGAGERLTPSE